jgi:pimeloyl-ACP methyl ester carboxylesterase
MTIAQQAATPRHVTAPTLMRATIRALAAVAPPLAVRAAAMLFRKPIRMRTTPVTAADAQPFAAAAGRHTVRGIVRGEGPLVILAHGWGGAPEQFEPLAAALLARGHRVATFAAIGHPPSTGRLTSMVEFRDGIRAVASHFGPRAGDIHAIVGHSLGAASSALAVSEGIATKRLVLISPSAHPQRYLDFFLDWLDVPGWMRERVLQHFERTLRFAWRNLDAEVWGPAIASPTLIVHDRNDKEVPWQEGADAARAIPNAELVTVEGLGHRRILADANVIARVADFLAPA